MAVRNFFGALSDNFQTAGNYVEGVAPIAGDDVKVRPDAVHGILSGLDNAALTLASFTVPDEFRHEIGYPFSPFIVACSSKFIDRGAGNAYLKPGTAGIARLICDKSQRGVVMSTNNLGGGAPTLEIIRGRCLFDWTAATTVYVAENDSSIPSELYVGSPLIASSSTLWIDGGFVSFASAQTNLTNVYQNGGELLGQDLTIGTYRQTGGRLMPISINGFTITTLHGAGGVLDLLTNAVNTVTVTTMWEWPASYKIDDRDASQILSVGTRNIIGQ